MVCRTVHARRLLHRRISSYVNSSLRSTQPFASAFFHRLKIATILVGLFRRPCLAVNSGGCPGPGPAFRSASLGSSCRLVTAADKLQSSPVYPCHNYRYLVVMGLVCCANRHQRRVCASCDLPLDHSGMSPVSQIRCMPSSLFVLSYVADESATEAVPGSVSNARWRC